MNRFEELLTALINGEDIGDWVPLSRLEEYLVRCCKREKADDIIPLTRTEVLLRQLAATIAEGGGGGGTEEITDLTGTVWYFNEKISDYGSQINLNFKTIGGEYASMSRNDWLLFQYGSQTVYDDITQDGWLNKYYRTIEITGGDDVKNLDVIAWLQSNATQIDKMPELPLEDLTGTAWRFNDTLSSLDTLGALDVDFTSNSVDYYSVYYSSSQKIGYVKVKGDYSDYDVAYDLETGWTDEAYRTIAITGGQEVFNKYKIAWLVENATQVEEEIVEPITDLTGTIWKFNDTIPVREDDEYVINLNFKTNANTYSSITFMYGLPSFDGERGYGADGWNNNVNETVSAIEIIDGDDVKNPDVIAWVQANATRIDELPALPELPVSDLTGTTWNFNETVVVPMTLDVTFTCNGTDYVGIIGDWTDNFYKVDEDSSNNVKVYNDSDGWVDETYRTITITGGEVVTDRIWINYLLGQATLVEEDVEPITGLAGTTWTLNDQLSSDGLTPKYLYKVNLKSANENFIGLQYIVNIESLCYTLDEEGNVSPIYKFNTNTYQNTQYKTITIIDGDDIENPELISWLEANATQVI